MMLVHASPSKPFRPLFIEGAGEAAGEAVRETATEGAGGAVGEGAGEATCTWPW